MNNVELGKNGRYRTNVWPYRGATKNGADAELALHPTVKPVAMLMDAIKDVTKRGDLVLDAFGGSGSTLLAAEKTRRKARMIEFEGGYCDVTIERWEAMTNRKELLVETGETFAAVKTRRQAEVDRLCDLSLGLEEAARWLSPSAIRTADSTRAGAETPRAVRPNSRGGTGCRPTTGVSTTKWPRRWSR